MGEVHTSKSADCVRGHLPGVACLVHAGLVSHYMVVFCPSVARGHDGRHHQGGCWHNEYQRSDQALERGDHERMLRVHCETKSD